MKNIFKLMGIAVLAAGMLASCGDKEGDEPTNDPTPGNGGGSYTITFNGKTWTPGVVKMYNYTDEGYLAVTAIYDKEDEANINAFVQRYAAYIEQGYATEGQGAQKPYVMGWLESTPGSYTNDDFGDYMVFYDATDVYTPAEDLPIGNQTVEAGSYYRWNVIKESATHEVTAIDLNALTMSASWKESCFDFEQAYVINNGQSYGDLKELSGKFTNYKWTSWVN